MLKRHLTRVPSRAIAVTAATTAAGASLARAILTDPQRLFGARIVTSEPDSAAVQDLLEMGAEVVDSGCDAGALRRAFDGAYGAYCAVDCPPGRDPERLQQEAAGLAAAARAAALKHVIWTTSEDTRERVPLGDERLPAIGGRYKVPCMDVRGAANRLFVGAGVPTTLLYTSFCWDSLLAAPLRLRPATDGAWELTVPLARARLSGIAAADIGKCAYGVFRSGPSLAGASVGLAAEQLTGEQLAARFADALGTGVRYAPCTWDAFRAGAEPGATELANMFQYQAEYEESYCGMRAPSVARQLNPELLDFAGWLRRNAAVLGR